MMLSLFFPGLLIETSKAEEVLVNISQYNNQNSRMYSRYESTWYSAVHGVSAYAAPDFGQCNVQARLDTDRLINRGYLVFDTSSLSDDIIITCVNISFPTLYQANTGCDIYVQDSGTGSSIEQTDFNMSHYGSTYACYAWASSLNAFNLTFDQNISTSINLTGYTTFVLRTDWDYEETEPSGSTNYGFYCYEEDSITLWITYETSLDYDNYPVITTNSENPLNEATNVFLYLTDAYNHFNISVTDKDDYNQSINITWRTNESGSWTTMGTNQSTICNATFYCTNVSWIDEPNKTYWWSVNVSDNATSPKWANATYSFTTRNNTWYVAYDGDDSYNGTITHPFQTIQKAINASSNGSGTIIVREGTYTYQRDPWPWENKIWVNRSGTADGYFTIRNYTGETVILNATLVNGEYNDALFHLENVSYLRISGFIINHSGGGGICLIYGNDHILIDNCTISHSDSFAIRSSQLGQENLTIENNTFYDNQNCWNDYLSQEVLSLSGVVNCTIQHNYFLNNRYINIDTKSAGNNIEIRYNLFNLSSGLRNGTQHNGYAWYIDQRGSTSNPTHNCSFHHNMVWGNASGICLGNEGTNGAYENISIYDNIFNISNPTDDSGEHGYYGIVITRDYGSGGTITMAKDINIYHNTFFNGLDTGNPIRVRDHYTTSNLKRLNISNNIITTYYADDLPLTTFEGVVYTDTGSVTMNNNLWYCFHPSYQTEYIQWGATPYSNAQTAYWHNNPLFSDPEFNAAQDFHLNSTSPAVNTGTSLLAASTDYDDIARPQFTYYDIGAYESTEEPPMPTWYSYTFGGSVTVQLTLNAPTFSGWLPTGTGQSLTPTANVTIWDTDGNDTVVDWYISTDNETWGTPSRHVAAHTANTSDSYTVSEATAYNTKYYIKVCANDGSYNSTKYWDFTTINYTPDAPTLTGATANSDTQITITWTDDTEADSTYIEWDSVNDASWNRGDHNDTSINGTSGSELHTGLTQGTTYYYKAWSWNATQSVWSAGSNIVSETTKSITWHSSTFGGSVEVTSGVVLYVATDGNDETGTGSFANPYATLQKAINESSTGYTIYMKNGTYTYGNSILMYQKDNITIEALYGPGKVILNGTNVPDGHYLNAILEITESDYIHINNITFEYSYNGGLTIDDTTPECSYIYIQNCSFYNHSSFAIKANHGNHIYVGNNYIENCYNNWSNPTDFSQETISFSSVDYGYIYNNMLYKNRAENIDVKYGSTWCYIYNNTINTTAEYVIKAGGKYWGGIGIYLDSIGATQHNISVYGNNIYGNTTAIQLNIEADSSHYENISIYNNIINMTNATGGIHNVNGRMGIAVMRGDAIDDSQELNKDVYIYMNTIHIGDNVWYSAIQVGISACKMLRNYMKNLNISNNIITLTDKTATPDPRQYYVIKMYGLNSTDGTNYGCFYLNNNLYNDSYPGSNFRIGFEDGDWTKTTGPTKFGNNPLFVVPEFYNNSGGATGFDPRLNSSSPCINYAMDSLVANTDYYGTERPRGAGYDIGAYEYPVTTYILGNNTVQPSETQADLGQYGPYCTNFTSSFSGTLNNITAYLQFYTSVDSWSIQGALYYASNLSLIATTEATLVGPNTDAKWVTCNFAEPLPTVTSGVQYLLALDSDADNEDVYFRYFSVGSWSARNNSANTIAFGDPWTTVSSFAREFCIYASGYVLDAIDCELNSTTWTIGSLGVGNSATKNFTFWQNGSANIDIEISFSNTNFSFVNYSVWAASGYNQYCANFTLDDWSSESNINVSPYNATLQTNFAPGSFTFGIRIWMPKTMSYTTKHEDFEVILTVSEHT